MFLQRKFFSGPLMALLGKPISILVVNGKVIWQAVSKYWRRRDKWKRNQKW